MLQDKILLQVGGTGRKFHPVPASIYTVQISDVNSKEALSTFTGKTETMLNFEFIILDDESFDYKNDDGEQEIETTRGRRLWKMMRPVISDGNKGKASWLYKLLCATEQASKNADYFAAVDPNTLIGTQVSVMVNKALGGNKIEYNNILDFMVPKKLLEPFEKSDQELTLKKEPPKEVAEISEDAWLAYTEKPKVQ